MAKRWKKTVDEGKEGKSLRRSEASRLWKKRTEEVKKEEDRKAKIANQRNLKRGKARILVELTRIKETKS